MFKGIVSIVMAFTCYIGNSSLWGSVSAEEQTATTTFTDKSGIIYI